MSLHTILHTFYASNIGTRERNEDNFLVPHRRIRALKTEESGEIKVEINKAGRFATFAVADGMGGENNGHVASLNTIRALSKGCRTEEINERILNLQKRYGKCGSTLVCCQFRSDGKSLISYIESIGDSPCFLIRDGHIKKITRDDNVYQDLLESNSLPESDEDVAYAKSGLTQYYGKPYAEIHKYRILCEPGDMFVLSSDGVALEENDEAFFLQHENPALTLVNNSVDENKRFAAVSDNTTAIVIKVEV